MTNEEWYTYVPLNEHAANHRYCDPVLCPAWIEELDRRREKQSRQHAEWGEWCWCGSVHPTDRECGIE